MATALFQSPSLISRANGGTGDVGALTDEDEVGWRWSHRQGLERLLS
jgi:hypothetical protein